MTEPNAGSDPEHMRTRAVRKGGDYVLNGSKMWITNGELADVAVIRAHTEEGIRGFLVEKGMPGFQAFSIPRKYSLRASVTSGLILDDVRVLAENLLPGTDGIKSGLMCSTEKRFPISRRSLCHYPAKLSAAIPRVQLFLLPPTGRGSGDFPLPEFR